MSQKIHRCCLKIPQRYVACAVTASAMMVCNMSQEVYLQSLGDMLFFSFFEDKYPASKCPIMISPLDEHSHAVKADVYWTLDLMRAVTRMFFIGIMISSVPAGMIADHYGVRMLMGLGILVNLAILVLFPILTYQSAITSVVGRFVQGLAQGIVYAASETILAQWTLPSERATMTSIVAAAEIGGRIMAYGVRSFCKLLSDRWYGQYYFAALIGVLWMLVWYWFCYNEPKKCPHLSAAELEKIHKNHSGLPEQKQWYSLKVPWKSILRSCPLVTLLLAFWPSYLMYYTAMQSHQDTYLVHVVKVTPDLARTINTMGRVCQITSTLLWGVASDWLVNNGYISRTNNRVVLIVLSNICMAASLVVMPQLECNAVSLVAVTGVLFFSRGLGWAVYRAALIDLSPRYAGLLMAMMNVSAATSAFVSWEMVLYILDIPSDISKWQKLFIICGAFLVLMSLPYIIYGSAEEQKWNFVVGTDTPQLNELASSTQIPQRSAAQRTPT